VRKDTHDTASDYATAPTDCCAEELHVKEPILTEYQAVAIPAVDWTFKPIISWTQTTNATSKVNNFHAHTNSNPITDPEGSRRLRLPDFKTAGTWRWQGCQPYVPAALKPRKYSWYSFLLEAESTPRAQCRRKDYVNEKSQWHHRESNPRPSGLKRSVSTNCANACMLNTYNEKDKRDPVNKAWRVLRVRIDERRPIWRAAEKILNKQSRTDDMGWSSCWGVWARC